MKMMSDAGCCEKCVAHIARIHTNAARLWLDLCALRLSRGEYVKIRTTDFHEMRLLENLGFVVTTEHPPHHLIVQIKHLHNEDGEQFFCLKEIHG